MSKLQYFQPMFERLTPRTPWAGGRMTDTDVLTLADAASMATKHAGEPVTIGDFLRAAARGEITLRAIVHRTAKVQKHDGGIYCNGGQETENMVPAGAIPTLPLTACQHLAAAGRANWRTFDGFEMVEGVLQRYTMGQLVAGEPDFETLPDDCRVMGYDVHALADQFTKPAPAQNATTPAPASASNESLEGIATSQVAVIFDGFSYSADNWKRRLSDTKWLEPARLALGAAGGATSLWCPVKLAQLIHGRAKGPAKQKTLEALNRKFKNTTVLAPWRSRWDEHYSMFTEADDYR